MKILMVLTSHDQLGDTGKKTGFWLEEFAAPYYVLKDAGAQITLASPKGGPKQTMVGERGFEPPAPASRRQCSTRLSYSPTGTGPCWSSAGARVS